MFNLVPVRLGGCILAAMLTLGPVASQAAVVNFSLRQFDRSALAQAQKTRSDVLAGYQLESRTTETFEGQKAWDGHSGTRNPQDTRVGSFSAITDMGRGSGQSVIDGGTGTEVRNDNGMAWGRYNTD